jgi:hypothetical protein
MNTKLTLDLGEQKIEVIVTDQAIPMQPFH